MPNFSGKLFKALSLEVKCDDADDVPEELIIDAGIRIRAAQDEADARTLDHYYAQKEAYKSFVPREPDSNVKSRSHENAAYESIIAKELIKTVAYAIDSTRSSKVAASIMNPNESSLLTVDGYVIAPGNLTSPNGLYRFGISYGDMMGTSALVLHNNATKKNTGTIWWDWSDEDVMSMSHVYLTFHKNQLYVGNDTRKRQYRIFKKFKIPNYGFQLQDDGNLHFIDIEGKNVHNGQITHFKPNW